MAEKDDTPKERGLATTDEQATVQRKASEEGNTTKGNLPPNDPPNERNGEGDRTDTPGMQKLDNS